MDDVERAASGTMPRSGTALQEQPADVAPGTARLAACDTVADGHRSLIEYLSDGIFVSDPEGHYLEVNPAGCEMLGYERVEMLRLTIADVLAHEEWPRLREEIARLSATPLKSEWRFRRKDGSTFYGEVNVRQLPDSRFLAVLRDITPLHSALGALRESDSRFRALIDDMDVGVVVQDAEDRILSANTAARTILGGDGREELAGLTSRDPRWQLLQEDGTILLPDRVPSVLAARTLRPVRNVVVGALNLETRARKWLRVTALPRLGADGGLQHVLVTVVDVTQRRAAEQRLLESQRHLVASQHVAGVGSWEAEVTPDGQANERSLTWSDECYRVFGYTPGAEADPVDLFWRCLHPDDTSRIEEAIAGAVATGGVTELDHRIIVDGKVRVIHERAELVRHPVTNAPTRFIGTAQDVTDQLALEEQLRQAQKMEAVGQLAGGVAHDFNNVLTVIGSCSEMLLQELAEAPESVHEALVAIRDAGQRASLLTRQLLVFSRKAMVEPRVLDVNAVIEHAVRMLRRVIPENIAITTALASDLASIKVDPGQMEQVIINLALNARDAMDRGGNLTLTTRNATIDAEAARSHPGASPGQFVQFLVSDTGTGMSPEVRSHLFEPFFTTKPVGKGTGLGLTTVYSIVHAGGGFITVDSAQNSGTTFTVSLPLARDGAPVKPGPARARTRGSGSETVLVVEDEADVRQVARRVLESEGYRVLTAKDGPEALAILDHELHVDLLLTDVVMPGMNGREVAARVRARLPDCRVLLMSGYFDDATIAGEQNGAGHNFSLLQKPFSLEGLASKVREVLMQRA